MLQESYQNVEALYEQYEFVKFIPFNPTDKYTIAFIKDKHSGETIRLMKGAPQVNPPSQFAGLPAVSDQPCFSHSFRRSRQHMLACTRLQTLTGGLLQPSAGTKSPAACSSLHTAAWLNTVAGADCAQKGAQPPGDRDCGHPEDH